MSTAASPTTNSHILILHPPRAVVVGYGYAGRAFHSYLIGLTPGLALHGVASRDPEKRQRASQEHGCDVYGDLDEVLADPDVDLVVIATPNATHAELAIRALNAGKHVVTDKIMCMTLDECERMIAAAQRNRVMLSVFQNRRFDGDFLTLRRLIADGRLGRVRWGEMAWGRFGSYSRWRGEAAMGGGRFYDLGAHLVDQMLLLFPQGIHSVYCRMQHDLARVDVESASMIVIGFEDGATGICDMSSIAAIEKPRFYFCGLGGTFCKYGLDPQEAAMRKGAIDTAVEDESAYGCFSDGKEKTIVPTIPGRWRDYYENIAAVLTRGAEPVVKYAEMRRAMAVFDAAVRSARTGETVRVDLPAL